MLIGTHQRLATAANFNVSADSTNLEQVQKFKYLGIFLDHTLLWKEHISYIGSKISSRLGMIRTERAKSCHDQLVLLFTIAWSYRYLTTVQMSGTVVALAAKTTSSDLIDELPVSLRIDQSPTKKSRKRYYGQIYNPEGLPKMRLGLQVRIEVDLPQVDSLIFLVMARCMGTIKI